MKAILLLDRSNPCWTVPVSHWKGLVDSWEWLLRLWGSSVSLPVITSFPSLASGFQILALWSGFCGWLYLKVFRTKREPSISKHWALLPRRFLINAEREQIRKRRWCLWRSHPDFPLPFVLNILLNTGIIDMRSKVSRSLDLEEDKIIIIP